MAFIMEVTNSSLNEIKDHSVGGIHACYQKASQPQRVNEVTDLKGESVTTTFPNWHTS